MKLKLEIRKIQPADAEAVIGIDAMHTGIAKAAFWRNRLAPLFSAKNSVPTLGYVAVADSGVIGYVLAEGRAWEFGSPLCGWIFALGVRPEFSRQGVALGLTREVCKQFKKMGIETVRTMVKKDDVDVLKFFRASGFHAGPFIELELEL